ncbi:enoyl-CoA hydratase/isomerase family protein [Alkalihalobacillus sp. TS-13]|uniref:enoyl-CoA hydratase/isomerase family protein n=1 Tax=Alkalihalobacillus sp. TS-13 TaxID=2842455 RepID=UPI001C86E0C0|nr:enoyl-CoA hydratase/isomerase family protein [Alkalihalobacillus sp. TS-13]
MNYQTILYEVSQNILTITINRPKTYNALSTSTKDELSNAFQRGNEDKNVKAIIIKGVGDKAFCSGQDLKESQHVSKETADKWVDEFDKLYRIIRKVEKPIIASINGFSTGSGLQLALLADIRISKKSAKYGMTEINVGLPCVIGSTMFWEVMGKSRTIDLILTGRLIKADEAREYGLITRVVDDEKLESETLKLANELASKPPVALAINKRRFNQISEYNFNSCMEYAIEAHTLGYQSGEPQKMMKEFFEKRSS